MRAVRAGTDMTAHIKRMDRAPVVRRMTYAGIDMVALVMHDGTRLLLPADMAYNFGRKVVLAAMGIRRSTRRPPPASGVPALASPRPAGAHRA